jgi:hypothetical protein
MDTKDKYTVVVDISEIIVGRYEEEIKRRKRGENVNVDRRERI